VPLDQLFEDLLSAINGLNQLVNSQDLGFWWARTG
jgi:hypothetical protein